MSYYTTFQSPVGVLVLTSNGTALTGIYPPGNTHYKKAKRGEQKPALFKDAVKQLTEYFAGKRTNFELKLATEGTPFQKKTWQQLQKIPYGKTINYGQLATKIGSPKAYRAAGSANGRNQFCIVVPCHRVIAANGDLGGYNGGLKVKEWLLRHEAKN